MSMRGQIQLSARAAHASPDHATLGFPVVGIGASAGFFRHLTKPLDIEVFRKTIAEMAHELGERPSP